MSGSEQVDAQEVARAVQPLAERAAQRQSCELCAVRFVNESGQWVLRIVIDRDEGVDVENCARVSRQLSAMLDVDDIVPGTYTLEVSSPGLDRELHTESDYRRFAGSRVRIQVRRSVDGRRVVRGTLRGVTDGAVVIEDGVGAELTIPLESVSEARLEVEV